MKLLVAFLLSTLIACSSGGGGSSPKITWEGG